MYIPRHAEKTVQKLAKMFGAILVVGPRQVGKTTMLQKVTYGFNYATMDDPFLLAAAQKESITFFKDFAPPVFIDEIQKAPELFPLIKMILDRKSLKGQFYMSGSQQLMMMKHISESLAGRIGILNLLGMSLREMRGISFDDPFLPTTAYFSKRQKEFIPTAYNDVWHTIHRGSMPALCENPDYDWQMFYGSYVSTYIERDIRALSAVGDTIKFMKFMSVVAASTGQLLNISSMARDVGISQPTAERWLAVLVASHLVYLLKPYTGNIIKRVVKTPKLYFLDTGLAAYLTRWNTAEVLKNGAMAGAFFESFVIAEIIKSYYNYGVIDPPLWFYRDKEMNEIDLIIEDGGTLYPLEIKKHADPTAKDISAFSKLEQISGVLRGAGGVICLYDDLRTLKGADRVIPISYI